VLLYLVRHGEALPADTGDASRALSPKGVADADKVAFHLGSLGISIHAIIHSTKARAKQTADIIAHRLKPPKGISESGDLGPLADPSIMASKLETIDADLMLVGHMPYMSKLASLLVCGCPDESALVFETCSVACLIHYQGVWQLLWFVSPSVIGKGQQG
jgi:phosphohistidine phosphatase